MHTCCEKCGTFGKFTQIEEHHLKPKFLGGTDSDGRIMVCKMCHIKLHAYLGDKCIELAMEWLKQ